MRILGCLALLLTACAPSAPRWDDPTITQGIYGQVIADCGVGDVWTHRAPDGDDGCAPTGSAEVGLTLDQAVSFGSTVSGKDGVFELPAEPGAHVLCANGTCASFLVPAGT